MLSPITSMLLVIILFVSSPITAFAVDNNDVYALSYHVGSYDMFPEGDGSISVTIDGTKYFYSDDYDNYDDISNNFNSMENQNVLYELHENKIVRVYSLDNVLTPKVTVEPSIKEGLIYRNGKFSQNSFDIVINVSNRLTSTFQKNDLLWFLNDIEKERLYTTLKKLEIEPSNGVDFGASGWWLWKEYQTNISESFNDNIKVNETKEYHYTVNLQNDKVLNQKEYDIELYTTPTFDFGTGERTTSKIKVGNLDYQEEKTEEKKANSTSGKSVTQASIKLAEVKNALQFSKNLLNSDQTEQVNEFVNLWISELILARCVDKSDIKQNVSEQIANQWLSKLGLDTSVLLIPGTIQATTYLKTQTKDGTQVFIELYINLTSFDFGNSGMPTMATGSGSATIYNMNGEQLDSSVILPAYADVCAFCEQLQKIAKDTIFNGAKQYRTIFGIDTDATAEALSSQIMVKLLNNNYTKDVFKRVDAKGVKTALKKLISEGDKKCGNKIFELVTTPSQNSTLISVKCPVDVTVYDNDGNICGMVRNNVVDTSYSDVFISVVGDQKNIYLIGDDYTFTMSGTDSGKMDYVVTEFDESGTKTREITYENIELSDGCKYYSYVPEAVNHNSSLFDLTDSEGNVISATTGMDFEKDISHNGSCGSNVFWVLSEDGLLNIYGSGRMNDFSESNAPWYPYREDISEVLIADGITYIGRFSFQDCNNLVRTNIPINITSIGYFAFYNCESLNTIDYNAKNCELQENSYDGYAYTRIYYFLNSDNISNINIGKYVEDLPFYVFYEMDNIRNIIVDSENKVYCSDNNVIYNSDKSELLFYATGLNQKYFEVPESVKLIAFIKNNTLETIYLHDNFVDNSNKDIYNNFWNLRNATNLQIIKCSTNVVRAVTDLVANKKHESYFSSSYTGCVKSIKGIELTDAPTEIEDYLFSGLTELEQVVLPNSIKRIGVQAFSYCKNLKEINIPENVESIEESAFWYCNSLDTISVDGQNDNYHSYNNCLYDKDMTNLILVSRAIKELNIPEGVLNITPYALGDCKNLIHLNIPSTLIDYGSYLNFYECENMLSINVDKNNNCYSSVDGFLLNKEKTLLLQAPRGIENCAIPECVNIIGNRAFDNCNKLINVEFSSKMTGIEEFAFYNCKSLLEITVPYNITYIDKYALGYYLNNYYDTSMKNFSIVGYSNSQAENYAKKEGFSFTTIGDAPIEESDFTYELYRNGKISITGYTGSLSEITIPSTINGHITSSIESNAFENCTNLKSVTIPESVKSIGRNAFSGCTNLSKVNYTGTIDQWAEIAFSGMYSNPTYNCNELYINNHLVTEANITTATKINNYAFVACENLASVTVGNSVTSIGENAFSDCANLANVTIGNSVTSIGEYAFSDCANLANVMIGNSVTSIGERAFDNCINLTRITIPNSVKSIGDCAFSSCTNLQSVTLGDNVISIGSWSFGHCEALISVTIPDSVTNIGGDAFSGCTNLSSVTIGKNVTRIGAWAFADCENLSTIIIPDGVTDIGEYAFNSCTNLANVTIANSVTSIGEYAFSNCDSLRSILLPDNLDSFDGTVLSSCSKLTDIFANETSKNYSDKDGVLYNKAGDTIVYYPSGRSDNFQMPYGIKIIADRAFYRCTKIKSVIISNSVTDIGDDAFSDCTNLTNVTIGDSVTSIGEGAFSYCENMESISLPNSLKSIGEYAFSGAYSWNGDLLYKLSDVYFSGEEHEWNSINIGDGNNNLTSANIHFNTITDDYLLSKVVKEPTCSNDGEYIYTCPHGYTKTKIIPALDHIRTVKKVVPPTCTQDGYTLCICDRCGEEYETDYVDAIGHNGETIKEILFPTCTQEGYTLCICDGCGEEYRTDYVGALGHDLENDICIRCKKDKNECIESAHPYGEDCNESWIITEPDARNIKITFSSQTEVESGYDYIEIYDGSDKLIGKYTGDELASKCIFISGDTAKITLISDSSVTSYGFSIDKIEYNTTENGIIGDVNGDGVISVADAAVLQKYIIKSESLSDEQLAVADTDGNGDVNIKDVTQIQKYLAKFVTVLG